MTDSRQGSEYDLVLIQPCIFRKRSYVVSGRSRINKFKVVYCISRIRISCISRILIRPLYTWSFSECLRNEVNGYLYSWDLNGKFRSGLNRFYNYYIWKSSAESFSESYADKLFWIICWVIIWELKKYIELSAQYSDKLFWVIILTSCESAEFAHLLTFTYYLLYFHMFYIF